MNSQIKMRIVWNADTYLKMIQVHRTEVKRIGNVTGTRVHEILQSSDPVRNYSLKSVAWHWSTLKRIAKILASMETGLPLKDYQTAINTVVGTDVAVFTEEQVQEVRKFGAEILEKSTSLPVGKPKAVPAVVEESRKRVNPRVEVAILRLVNDAVYGPLNEVIKNKIEQALADSISSRIAGKIVNQVAARVCDIFYKELEGYAPEQPAKRARVSDSPEEEEESEDDESSENEDGTSEDD